MVPPSSHRIPRVRWYSGYRSPSSYFAYRTLTVSGRASHPVRLYFEVLISVRTPAVLLLPVWPLPISLATTFGISFDFSSSGYLDVSLPRVPLMHLLIQCMIHDYSSWGLPHSEISGSTVICTSPKLIAACRVLLRLLMPRHSPCALISLNFFSNSFFSLFSRSLNHLSFANNCYGCCYFVFCHLCDKIVVTYSRFLERPMLFFT